MSVRPLTIMIVLVKHNYIDSCVKIILKELMQIEHFPHLLQGGAHLDTVRTRHTLRSHKKKVEMCQKNNNNSILLRKKMRWA